MRTDVAIVGAGMAGMTAALDLRDAGLDAVVIEAGSRPGGRARTVDLGDGQWAESGGEWIDTAHVNIHALLKRYDLRTVGDAAPWWEREAGWIDDHEGLRPPADAWLADAEIHADFARFDHLVTVLAAGIADPADPASHADAQIIDARSGADLFDELDLGEFARFMLTRAIEFEYAVEPSQISALFLAQQRAVELREEAEFGEIRSQRVDGGISRLANAMADDLGEVMRYREPLQRLEHGTDGVVLHTSEGVYEAAHAILALPLPPLRRVVVEPKFDGRFADAVANLAYGSVTKTFVRYPDRDWPFGWAVSRRFLQRIYDATEDQPGPAGILDAYVGGDGAKALQTGYPDDDERLAHVRAEIEDMVPALAGRALAGVSRAWHPHENYGGAFSCYGPGDVTAYWRAIREPQGRVHLAGEHVATVTGYLEGAVESGHRTADAVVRSAS